MDATNDTSRCTDDLPTDAADDFVALSRIVTQICHNVEREPSPTPDTCIAVLASLLCRAEDPDADQLDQIEHYATVLLRTLEQAREDSTEAV